MIRHDDEDPFVREVWAGLEAPLVLVPSSIDNGEDPGSGMGELLAMPCAMAVLRQYYSPDEVQILEAKRWDGSVPVPSLPRSFIGLGGCHSNALTAAHLGGMGNNPYFRHTDGDPGFQNHAVRMGKGRSWHATEYSGQEPRGPYSMAKDFGVIVWRETPEGRRVSCIGAHTYGTYATALSLFYGDFCKWYIENGRPAAFQLLVSIDGIKPHYDEHDRHVITFLEGETEGGTLFPSLPPPFENFTDLAAMLEALLYGAQYQRKKREAEIYQLAAFALMTVLIGLSAVAVLASFGR